ncbi:MAG: tetratricopeptide repeat protein [Bacteroidales bacterium]|nr:tetratricopeptide repeat protein [Bacteroidales bacterium]
MKKGALLLGLLACFAFAKAQDIDSLYQVFERGRGEAAYRAAVAIDEALGREPNFGADTDKDEIQQKLLRTMILYFYNNNDFQHVVQYSEVGIAHYAQIGDLFNEAGCTMTLANAYQRFGQLDKALECYNRCSDLMDEIGGEMAAVNKRYVMNNIAEIHLSMDEYGRAEELYRKCIAMLGEVDVNDTASNLDLATYLQNLAEVRIAQARISNDKMQLDEAVKDAERSLELSQRYHDSPHKVINRLMTLSKAYEKKDDAEKQKSAQLLDEALKLAEDNNEIFLQAVIHLQRGDYAKAIAMAEENHYDKLLQEALETAYQHERDKNPKEALDYYERSMAMKDSIFNETQQQLIRDYQVRYATQEKEHELAMEREKSRRNRLYIIVLTVVALLILAIAAVLHRLAIVRKKRNEELAHLNTTKDRLLSIVSHDVKTPVGAMCQVLRTMTTDYDTLFDTDRKAKLVMLHTTTEALNERMENIIRWVKGELGNNEKAEPADFNLSEIVGESIKALETTIVAKSLKVSDEVPKEMAAHDDANVVRLVLHNLLSNAVKYSFPEGEVSVKAEAKGDRIWISVADNGMGINEKKLEKIFKFMTSSASGTGGETGTGIGLFVSKHLIDKIGGEITIESAKDAGTVVRFSVRNCG